MKNESHELEFVTADACGSVDSTHAFVIQHKTIPAVLLITIGLALGFFGGYKWEAIIGVIGTIIGSIILTLAIIIGIGEPSSTFQYIVFALIIIAFGILLYKLFQINSAFVFFVFGLFFGSAIASNFMIVAGVPANLKTARLCYIFVGALVGLVCFFMYKTLAIFITAITGGLLISSGIGLIVGMVNYEAELKENSQLQAGLKSETLVLFFIWLVFASLGAFV